MDAAPLDGRDEPGNHDEHERSWRAAAGLVGVLAGLTAVVWILSLTTGDGNDIAGRDADPVDQERFEAPTTTSPPPETEASPEVVSEDGQPEGAAPAEPFSEMEGRLMYLSGRHVALVDLATGAVQRVPIEPSGSRLELAALELLTDGERTVGLSWPGGELSALLVASGAELVPSTHPLVDFWVISRPDGPGGAIWMNAWQDYGVLTGGLQAPPGSEVVVVGNAGVLVTPPVGRTYRPTFAGFEVVSEHRLLAASDQLRVEQRCDEQLSCTVVVVDAATDRATELPEDFVAELAGISVSPDGRWLLNDTSPAWLFDRQTGQLRLLDGGGYGRPRWSGDSTSVAWLTSDRTPTLVVARLEPPEEGQDWFAVELAGLGADPTPGSSFLLDATVTEPASG
ncbi:MAG: hypothetical protein J4F50_01450 [Acidimicrobiia bacterium]|nr:hypothetical protein [Acidimicrobiia bacterium]